MERYCVIGSIDGYTRYAVVERGVIVDTQISRPEGKEVPPPHPLRFARRAVESAEVKRYLFNNPIPIAKAGEQPRRPVWSRAGKRAAREV